MRTFARLGPAASISSMSARQISALEQAVLSQARTVSLDERELLRVAPQQVWTVIVTYNSVKWLDGCIRGLKAQSELVPHVIVVDNHSTDATLDTLRGMAADVDLVLLAQTDNLGYGKACNIGIEEALRRGADYVLVLNPDVELFPLALAEMLLVAEESPNAGPITPVHVNQERNRVEPGCFWFLAHAGSRHMELPPPGQPMARSQALDYISGAIMLFSANALRMLGGFDELFYFYGEDNDLCRRYALAGLSPLAATRAQAFHWHQSYRSLDAFRRANQRRANYRLIAKKPTRPLAVGLLAVLAKGSQDLWRGRGDRQEMKAVLADIREVLAQAGAVAEARALDSRRQAAALAARAVPPDR